MIKHRCWHYKPSNGNYNAMDPCPKCDHWSNKQRGCKDHELLKQRQYEESKSFRATDFMMRTNKGVRVDG